jgi:hypothetical protein
VESGFDLAVIIFRPATDAIASIIVPRSGAFAAFRQRQHQRSIRKIVAYAKGIDRPDGLDTKSAGTALVSERTVDEAIRQDPLPIFKRWPDRLRDMVGSSGREQQGLGLAPQRSSLPLSNSSRIFSAPSLPPGSRVTMTSSPRCRSASASAFT